jgi:hypothetical protein
MEELHQLIRVNVVKIILKQLAISNFCKVVPPYTLEIRSKTYRGYVKPRIMQIARKLDEVWRQVLQQNVSTGAKENESSTGRVWVAGFHHVTARSRLERVLKIMNCLFP